MNDPEVSLPVFDDSSYPLYFRGENRPLDVYLTLTMRGEISVTTGPLRHPDYTTGKTLFWRIDPCFSGTELNAILSAIKPYLEKVNANRLIECKRGECRGRLTVVAHKFSDVIQAIIDFTYPSQDVMTAHDFLFSQFSLKEIWEEGHTIGDIVEMKKNMVNGDIGIVGDIKEAILYEAKIEFENSDTPLPEYILQALIEENIISEIEHKEHIQLLSTE